MTELFKGLSLAAGAISDLDDLQREDPFIKHNIHIYLYFKCKLCDNDPVTRHGAEVEYLKWDQLKQIKEHLFSKHDDRSTSKASVTMGTQTKRRRKSESPYNSRKRTKIGEELCRKADLDQQSIVDTNRESLPFNQEQSFRDLSGIHEINDASPLVIFQSDPNDCLQDETCVKNESVEFSTPFVNIGRDCGDEIKNNVAGVVSIVSPQYCEEIKTYNSEITASQYPAEVSDATDSIRSVRRSPRKTPNISYKAILNNCEDTTEDKDQLILDCQELDDQDDDYIESETETSTLEKVCKPEEEMFEVTSIGKTVKDGSANPTLVRARTCPECEVVMESSDTCLLHYAETHDTNDKFTEIPLLLKSMGAKLKTEKKCPICNKELKYNGFSKHILLLHVWRPLQKKKIRTRKRLCELCGKVFNFDQNYYSHIRQVHKNMKYKPKKHRPKQYTCKECPYTTCEQRRLAAHFQYAHAGVKSYACKHCSYTTWERTSLRDHMFRHQDNKRYSCELCSYQCIQKKQLRGHMLNKHNKELPKTGQTRVPERSGLTQPLSKQHEGSTTEDGKTTDAANPIGDLTRVPITDQSNTTTDLPPSSATLLSNPSTPFIEIHVTPVESSAEHGGHVQIRQDPPSQHEIISSSHSSPPSESLATTTTTYTLTVPSSSNIIHRPSDSHGNGRQQAALSYVMGSYMSPAQTSNIHPVTANVVTSGSSISSVQTTLHDSVLQSGDISKLTAEQRQNILLVPGNQMQVTPEEHSTSSGMPQQSNAATHFPVTITERSNNYALLDKPLAFLPPPIAGQPISINPQYSQLQEIRAAAINSGMSAQTPFGEAITVTPIYAQTPETNRGGNIISNITPENASQTSFIYLLK